VIIFYPEETLKVFKTFRVSFFVRVRIKASDMGPPMTTSAMMPARLMKYERAANAALTAARRLFLRVGWEGETVFLREGHDCERIVLIGHIIARTMIPDLYIPDTSFRWRAFLRGRADLLCRIYKHNLTVVRIMCSFLQLGFGV
jgi:hypothetical protein